MVYAFIDDWLYLDIDGKTEVYGRQEIERNLKSKIKDLSVAFLDCRSKLIGFTDQRSAYQDALINASFEQDYVLTQEKISVGLIQVIAAKKEKIQEIYQYFKGINIQNLIPYPVAVRACLRSKGLLEEHKSVIFLDDLKNQAVLTVFEGMIFNSPRRINLRDSSYMISEIKRSWSNFLVEKLNKQQQAEQSFVLVCNNQQWILDFIEQGFLNREQIVHLDIPFVVLEGLKNAKFSVHFALAQDVLKEKKRQLWAKHLKGFVIGGLSISLGLGFYLGYSYLKSKESREYQHLEEYKQRIDGELEEAYQERFKNLLGKDRFFDYVSVYYDFIRSIPIDYLVDSIQFQRLSPDNWGFQGVIYPMNEKVKRVDFFKRGVFEDSKILYLITHKILGQKIESVFSAKDQTL